jgi:hypothetical protein
MINLSKYIHTVYMIIIRLYNNNFVYFYNNNDWY